MPLAPSFSCTQPVGEESKITITDTSTGSDVDISQRRVYLRTAQGTFLVPTGNDSDEYVEWPYADDSITIDALSKDFSILVTVQWLDTSDEILYAEQLLVGLTLYNETFDYSLTQLLASNPALWGDNNYAENKMLLRINIDAGNQAIELAADQSAAQQCYDRATNIRLNAQYLFNQNS